MGKKDATEKTLESYVDVFADIVNVLLFNGKRLMQPEDLLTALPRSIYKVDGKMHEQERDVAKFWKKGQICIAFIGLENQTAIEADIPFRIIGYDGAVCREQLNADEKNKPKERYPVVTLVLYFGYERRWNKPLNLKECFSIPKELEPFVNDYHVNLFEIAWLSDETIAMFQSDFRFVADYFSQKRKNQQYKAPAGEMKHVRAVLELLSAVMQDTRFIDAYNERVTEGRRRPTDVVYSRF
ncbi:MAG: Rpn family recombination-promoting nuclease/putative transposase [Selenomonadaceae bacterium]|nr:Rpn family recombination-promoting nuclease/putative transposase [Selenomonadaceae bacterium]